MRLVAVFLATFLNPGCTWAADLPLPADSESPCVSFGGLSPDHQWLNGTYEVVPVSPAQQAAMIRRVNPGAVKDVSRAFAQTVTGNDAVLDVAHYYLVRVGYVGVPGSFEHVDFSVDVDTEGVAYVSSFALSQRPEKKAELAAVLISPTPLKRVISSCGSAQ